METLKTKSLNDDDVGVETDELKPKDFPAKGQLITDEKTNRLKIALANDLTTTTTDEKLDNRSTSKLSKTNDNVDDEPPMQNGNSEENGHSEQRHQLVILDPLENSTCSNNGPSLKAVHDGITNIAIEENSNTESTDPLSAKEGETKPQKEQNQQRISVVRLSQNVDAESSNRKEVAVGADALPNGDDHSHHNASSSSSCCANHDHVQQSAQPPQQLPQQQHQKQQLWCQAAPSLTTTLVSDGISYVRYENESQMPDIMRLITKDLSEPYSIYTYRYFIHNWPKLCFLAMDEDKCVGAIVCKVSFFHLSVDFILKYPLTMRVTCLTRICASTQLDVHKKMANRGYIAMLAVDTNYRRRRIGSTLVG